MKPRRAASVSPTTVTRRTLLEWLGGATVLTLGADLLLACSDVQKARVDVGPPDARRDVLSHADDWSVSDAGFPFEPGGGNQKINGYWVAAGYPYDGEVPEARLRPGKY